MAAGGEAIFAEATEGKKTKKIWLSDVRRLLSVWGHVMAAGAGWDLVFFREKNSR